MPDATDYPPLIAQPSSHRIFATLGHLAPWLPKPACERTTRAYPPRRVQKYNGLGAFERKVECLVIVAVGDPGFARE